MGFWWKNLLWCPLSSELQKVFLQIVCLYTTLARILYVIDFNTIQTYQLGQYKNAREVYLKPYENQLCFWVILEKNWFTCFYKMALMILYGTFHFIYFEKGLKNYIFASWVLKYKIMFSFLKYLPIKVIKY